MRIKLAQVSLNRIFASLVELRIPQQLWSFSLPINSYFYYSFICLVMAVSQIFRENAGFL